MDKKNDSEKSFRIDDLLHTKDLDMPIELTTRNKLSPITVTCDVESIPPSYSQTGPKSQFTSPPPSPFPQPASILNPGYFTGLQFNHHNPFHFGIPRFIGSQLSVDGSQMLHYASSQFLKDSNQDTQSPLHFRQSLPQSSLYHSHIPMAYPNEYHLWGTTSGPVFMTGYDPRCLESKYLSPPLSIACGQDFISGRGMYPLHHGESKRKGGQIRFSNSQTSQLEKAFVDHKYQNAHERRKLALSLGLSDRQVKTWFQNRRAKWRKVGSKDEVANDGRVHASNIEGFESSRTDMNRPPIFDG